MSNWTKHLRVLAKIEKNIGKSVAFESSAELIEKLESKIEELEQQLKQQWVSVDDLEHIEWIYARLVNHYNENPSVDYISKFKSIIESLPKPPTK